MAIARWRLTRLWAIERETLQAEIQKHDPAQHSEPARAALAFRGLADQGRTLDILWAHGDGWERHAVSATACPRIPPTFLEEERSAVGQAWFAQEYLCEFIDDGGGWFSREIVEAALSDDEPLWL